VARVLSVAGYGVLQATDAAAALRLFEEEREHIALVLTDVQMPGMSGVELGVGFGRQTRRFQSST
jgi:CheY-like chemotaxis protein